MLCCLQILFSYEAIYYYTLRKSLPIHCPPPHTPSLYLSYPPTSIYLSDEEKKSRGHQAKNQ